MMAVLAIVGMAVCAQADTLTWTGGGATGNWSDIGGGVSNWQDSTGDNTVIPVIHSDLIFISGAVSSVNDMNLSGQGLPLNSITFDSSLGSSIVLSGSSIGLYGDGSGNGITNNSTFLQTLSFSNFSANAGGVCILASQTWTAAGGNLLITSAVTNTVGVNTLTIAGNHDTEISGAVTQFPTGDPTVQLSIEKTNGGILTLSGSNSYGGETTLTQGTLKLKNQNALQGSTLTMNGGSLVFDSSVGGAFTFGGLSAAVSGAQYDILLEDGVQAVALTVGQNNANTTYAANLSGAGTLLKTGTGTLTLSGSNTHGGTQINGGTLAVDSTGVINQIGGFYIGESGTGTLTIASGGSVSNDSGVIGNQVGSSGIVTVSGTWNNTLLTVGDSGTGTLTINGGAVTVNGGAGTLSLAASGGSVGTLNLGAGTTVGTLAALTVNGGNGTAAVNFNHNANYSFAPNLTGNLSVNLLGTGTTTLSGTNTYTGLTTVSAGELDLDTTGATSVGGNLTVSGGIAKFKQNGQMDVAKNLVVTSGTVDLGAQTQTLAGVQLTGGSIIGTSGVLTSTSDFDLQAGSVSAILGGTAGVIASTSGTVTLSRANLYSGPTSLTDGQLNLNNATAIGTGTLTIHNYAQLDNTSGALVTLANNNVQIWHGGFIFRGTNELNLGTGTVTLQTNSVVAVSGSDLTVGGAIVDNGSNFFLRKTGLGTLQLNGTSTYTGVTYVDQGTLIVSGSLASNVTVGDAGTSGTAIFGGGGIVGDVNIGTNASAGAVLRPDTASFGGSIGTTMNVRALNFTAASATLSLEIGRTNAGATLAGDSSSHVIATSVALANPNLELSLLVGTGHSIIENDVFYLVLSGTPVTGVFGSLNGITTTLSEGSVFTLGSQDFQITYGANSAGNSFTGGNDIAVIAVPEPGTWAMLAGGFCVLMFVQRIRRKSTSH